MNIRNAAAFALLHGIGWSLLSLLFFGINGFFTDPLGLLFTFAFILGHIFLFAWILWGISIPFAWLGPRTLQGVCVGLGGITSQFFCLDLLVYSQYRFHISPAMLELFFGPAGREIFAFSTAMWVVAVLAIVLLFAVEITLSFIAKRYTPSTRLIVRFGIAWGIIFLLYNGLYAWGKFEMVPSIISQRAVLPLANPLSANRRLRKLGFEPKKDPYATPATGTLNYPLAPLTCTGKAPFTNVLILLVDSWRADSVTPQIMPNLSARLEQSGISYFTNHLSGGNATEAGVFSLFYSLPYAYWNDFTSRQLPPVLVSQALALGYVPAIYSSGKLNSPTFHQNIFATVPNLRLESQGEEKWQRDENAVQDFEKFLDTRNPHEPFFGFIFLDAPHGSSYPAQDEIFTPAQEINYLLVNKNTDPTPYLNRYKNAVHFTDRMIERIWQDLQARGLLKNTVVIISGDHGQEINDTHHNFWGHNSNFAKYQTQVPLLVWDPAQKAAKTFSHRTTHYDIAPTLLARLYGCTNPAQDYSSGQDLFDESPRPFSLISSYTKKAIRTGNDLTVLDQYGGVEMYDENFNPSQGADPHVIKDALSEFARFYK
ncbi:MAG: sulfatase-like hydrolase/transferase [Elusimicrobiaceae bacterium]|nr:sulfatase-like hydrolase/transferase [Elusimicrobiaceae bacterium]